MYVLGNRTVVTKRPSLGDKYLDKESRGKGVMHLPRISCKADYCPPGPNQAAHQLAASVSCDMDEFCEAPPEWITHTLVRSFHLQGVHSPPLECVVFRLACDGTRWRCVVQLHGRVL